MNQHLRYWSQIRCVSRQRPKLSTLKQQTRGNRLGAPSHDALLIRETVRSQLGVDRFQVSSLWQWHEVVATGIADQVFDASLLPPGMDIGKEGFKAIDTLEMQEYVMFSPIVPFQHLEDRWLEIVIDRHARYSFPELEGMALAQHKGLLPLGGEAFDKHGSRKAQASGQKRDFHQLAFDFDGRLAKVKLRSLAWGKGEGNKGRFRGLSPLLHIQTHG